jgi:hypothetical protein
MSWDLYNQVKALFEEYNVDEMAIEDYMFKSNTCQGAHLNLYLRGALHMLCRSLGKPYTIMAISNWKSIIAGRSTPTNEMKKFYGKAVSNKILILEALWVRYNIRFPNHSISNKTKKPIGLKFDMVDAVGITIAYAYSKYNTKTVCNCVEFPSDVGTVKSAYSYNSEK